MAFRKFQIVAGRSVGFEPYRLNSEEAANLATIIIASVRSIDDYTPKINLVEGKPVYTENESWKERMRLLLVDKKIESGLVFDVGIRNIDSPETNVEMIALPARGRFQDARTPPDYPYFVRPDGWRRLERLSGTQLYVLSSRNHPHLTIADFGRVTELADGLTSQ